MCVRYGVRYSLGVHWGLIGDEFLCSQPEYDERKSTMPMGKSGPYSRFTNNGVGLLALRFTMTAVLQHTPGRCCGLLNGSYRRITWSLPRMGLRFTVRWIAGSNPDYDDDDVQIRRLSRTLAIGIG